jgi:hypothetical protein
VRHVTMSTTTADRSAPSARHRLPRQPRTPSCCSTAGGYASAVVGPATVARHADSGPVRTQLTYNDFGDSTIGGRQGHCPRSSAGCPVQLGERMRTARTPLADAGEGCGDREAEHSDETGDLARLLRRLGNHRVDQHHE